MVPIGDQPMLWHIMQKYGQHGFKKFVLCLGFKAEVIKSYFYNYVQMKSDFTVDLKSHEIAIQSSHHDEDWHVTLAYTGEKTMTGARVARAAEKYLGDAEQFAVTYGDGLTDADLEREYTFHQSHGKTGTVLGVNPPSRLGEIKTEGDLATGFVEKPALEQSWVNGGYFFFKRDFLKYLSTDEGCVLEAKPLVSLANDREMAVYKHSGFWASMDTQRDRDHLNSVLQKGNAPWLAR